MPITGTCGAEYGVRRLVGIWWMYLKFACLGSLQALQIFQTDMCRIRVGACALYWSDVGLVGSLLGSCLESCPEGGKYLQGSLLGRLFLFEGGKYFLFTPPFTRVYTVYIYSILSVS